MAWDLNNNLDAHLNQLLNVLAQILGSDPGSPAEGQFWYNNTTRTLNFRTNTANINLGRLDQITAPTASLNLNSQKIVSLADGTATNDAVNLGQLNNAIAGVNWKAAVRAATTAAGTLATGFENTDVIDGVTLATGDRILIKNQAAGAENGIYTVNASGAPTRSTDMDANTEAPQAAVFVREGTVNQDTGWVLTNNGAITLGTTALVFAQFTGGSITAGTGAVLSGSTLNVGAGATPGSGGPGGGLVANADDLVIDTSVVVRKYGQDFGNGALTSFTINHNLNTLDVQVAVWDKTTPFAEQHPEVRHTDANNVTLVFAVAPTTNQFRVSVQG